jgi:hypothetical protein
MSLRSLLRHECGGSGVGYALEQILQFFEIAWQIII